MEQSNDAGAGCFYIIFIVPMFFVVLFIVIELLAATMCGRGYGTDEKCARFAADSMIVNPDKYKRP